ncbi:MAG: Cys-tRNA(Pro) deacylase [Gammaproteobacteria bacterium]|nr:Cys-tRNA(Pro) deacylase [Gammaproteobacteria bacterium]
MTPAINLARKHNIPHQIHEYAHDPAHPSYGQEAADKLGVEPGRVFKTLVVKLDARQLVVAVVPVSAQLNMKLLARAAAGKKAEMADTAEVQRVTGYVLGGVSPLGQKRRLPTYIDQSASTFATIYISAGRRGLEIELDPQDLQTLLGAAFADLCQQSTA